MMLCNPLFMFYKFPTPVENHLLVHIVLVFANFVDVTDHSGSSIHLFSFIYLFIIYFLFFSHFVDWGLAFLVWVNFISTPKKYSEITFCS